ncbi:SCP-like protein [Ancylostoma caninum]|uniref:SCP-like protein n=1 Tax=Ancylostoma caninum TaxID=29170 RepID=A0A368GAQ0_ANCCA|nr:SCP-like protein [Ancylostoma caninum]
MADLYFIALVTSILAVLCQGAPTCGTGGVEESETSAVVRLINERRTALVDGTQRNGETGQNLPPAKSMNAITWSCDLEKVTQEGLKSHSCDSNFPPVDPQGRAQLYTSADNEYESTVEEFIASRVDLIDSNALKDVGPNSVKYTDATATSEYSNVMRATTTQIACTKKVCTDINMYVIYCITNQKALTNGEVIYEVGIAGQCTDCPAGTVCDPTSKLCVASGGTVSAGTASTTPATTATAASTTLPTSPEANFPSGW